MRLATFNVENLFTRPTAMNGATWANGRSVLTDFDKLNTILSKPTYTDTDKNTLKTILDGYDYGDPNARDKPFIIQEVRDKLYKVPKGKKEVEIVASGRDSWAGWVDLVRDDIDVQATSFTGKVIHEVNADILCTVEVEDRPTLDRFNSQVMNSIYNSAYPCNLCIDGNDPRGIDVGLLSRFPINSMRSHIFDKDGKGIVFSRDCAEYEVALTGGKNLWVLANHFKSKGYGSQSASDDKRKRQATRVAEIYGEARKKSELVAVVGDFNDFPESEAIKPLTEDTDLKEISGHDKWKGDRGTYGTGKPDSSKIDYILLSPALWNLVDNVGIERRGVYAPSLHIMWDGITKTTAASDHAAIWVDLNLG